MLTIALALGLIQQMLPFPRVIEKWRWSKWMQLFQNLLTSLERINLNLPLGKIISITGVSGSGKSTLINQTLYPALANKIQKSNYDCQEFENISGEEKLDKIIEINKTPTGAKDE